MFLFLIFLLSLFSDYMLLHFASFLLLQARSLFRLIPPSCIDQEARRRAWEKAMELDERGANQLEMRHTVNYQGDI